MTKRSKDDGTGALYLGGLALILLGLLTAIVYLPPLMLIAAVIYFEYRAKQAPNNFVLTPQEASRLAEIERDLARAETRLVGISREGAQLRINDDGSFHRGSEHGKRLNRERDELNGTLQFLYPAVYQIRWRPRDELNAWIDLAALRDATRLAVVAYVAVWLVAFLVESASTSAFSHFVGRYVFFRIAAASDAMYGAATITALVTAAIFAIGVKVFERRISASMAAIVAEAERIADGSMEFDPGDSEEEPEEVDEEEEYSSHIEEPEPKRWYRMLDVSSTASEAEISAAWKEKIKRNHPDKVAELDAEFRQLAEQRAQHINAAREEGLRQARARKERA